MWNVFRCFAECFINEVLFGEYLQQPPAAPKQSGLLTSIFKNNLSLFLSIVLSKVTSFLSSLIASRIIPGENRAQPGSVRVLTLFVIWWLGSLDFCLHAWILLQREKLHMCVKMKQCGELFKNTENRKTDRKETPRRTRSKNAN